MFIQDNLSLLCLDYSCSHRSRQGWLYISENYLGFHSFLLGLELKTLIELKDVQELVKERSKGIFDDSLRIITKDKEEVKKKIKYKWEIKGYNKYNSITFPICLKERKYMIC